MPSSASRSFSIDRDWLSALSLPDFRSAIFLDAEPDISLSPMAWLVRRSKLCMEKRKRGRGFPYWVIKQCAISWPLGFVRQSWHGWIRWQEDSQPVKLGYEPRGEERTVLSSKSEKYIFSLTRYIFENVIHLDIQLANWAILRRNPTTLKIRTN